MQELRIPKEYFRIASRFLKEVGLYSYWIEYLYNPHTAKNFNDLLKIYKPQDVLGCTLITDFLKEKGIYLPCGLCLYEIFARYVEVMHPEFKEEASVDACSSEFITIDKDKKKIKINEILYLH